MTIDTEDNKVLDLTDSTTHNDFSLLNKVQHRYSPSRRMRTCMVKPIPSNHNNITLSSSNMLGTKFIGLERCKSRWCPCCNKIEVAIQQGLMTMRHLQMIKNGYIPFFITLTQPRNSDIGKSNTDMGTFLKNWKRAIEHKYKEFGVKCKYMVSSKDFTFDLKRPTQIYHLHYHNLLYIPKEVFQTTQNKIHSLEGLNRLLNSDTLRDGVKSKVESFKASCKSIWTRITGYKAEEKGQDIQVAKNKDIMTYIKKIESANNITYEVVSKAKRKTHNKDTMTWIGLLEHIANTYDKRAIKVYREFLSAMKGKKLLNWGKGLKDLIIDEDIIEEVERDKEVRESNKEVKEQTRTFNITTALMKIISSMRLQGSLCYMLDGYWNGENIYSNNMFEFMVSEANKLIETPTTTINEMIQLKPFVLIWLESMFQDNIINEDRYNQLKENIY